MRNDSSRALASSRGRRPSLADARALSAHCLKTWHGHVRAAQRHLSDADVAYIVLYGCEIHRTGVIFHCLRAKDIPAQHRHLPEIMRLAGAVALTSAEDEIITLYRNAKAQRVIRRKMKYRFTPGAEVIGADVAEEYDDMEEIGMEEAG